MIAVQPVVVDREEEVAGKGTPKVRALTEIIPGKGTDDPVDDLRDIWVLQTIPVDIPARGPPCRFRVRSGIGIDPYLYRPIIAIVRIDRVIKFKH